MKCNYCGNNSGIKDDLGGCVSCGAFSEREISYSSAEAQMQLNLGDPWEIRRIAHAAGNQTLYDALHIAAKHQLKIWRNATN